MDTLTHHPLMINSFSADISCLLAVYHHAGYKDPGNELVWYSCPNSTATSREEYLQQCSICWPGILFIFLTCRCLFQPLCKNSSRIVPSPGWHSSTPHWYAASVRSKRLSATQFLTAPHRGKRRCRLNLTSSPAHFVFLAVCACKVVPECQWSLAATAVGAEPDRAGPALPRAPALSGTDLSHVQCGCSAQSGAWTIFLDKRLI